MAGDEPAFGLEKLLAGLSRLQTEFGTEVADVEQESPAAALDSLQDALDAAPPDYRPYLEEAVACYRNGLYRAAILMVWAAVMQHLYSVAASHRGGINEFEKANKSRYGNSKKYREIRKQGDFLYLGEHDFIQLGEDAGMFNRSVRKLLHERLGLRNLCGHPAKPGSTDWQRVAWQLAVDGGGDGAPLRWLVRIGRRRRPGALRASLRAGVARAPSAPR